jgi:hypothetical protein
LSSPSALEELRVLTEPQRAAMRAARFRALREQLRARMRRVCTEFSEEQFSELIERMARIQLADEERLATHDASSRIP